jgi:hypothetical protein
VPGGRAPHVWLEDGHGGRVSLFDRLGAGFTLLRLGPTAPAGLPIAAAARAAGVPVRVLDVPGGEARDLYGRDLALLRPDQHVAWRGDRVPSDPAALVRTVVGG